MNFSKSELLELTTKEGGSLNVNSLDEADAFCRKAAISHYENFPVGSVLIPKKSRRHFYSVYVFARTADDIADELIDEEPELRIKALYDYEKLLRDNSFAAKQSGNPIFISLWATIKEKNMPVETFGKLLTAFKRDINFKHADTMADLEDYCIYSANPIGELVLRIFDSYNEKTAELSDRICTGLQLINFWQDIAVDFQKGRIFIPKGFLMKYEINFNKNFIENLHDEKNSLKLSQCLNELYMLSENYLTQGSSLINYLTTLRLRAEIAVTLEGGRRILDKIRKLGNKIATTRPVLGKADYMGVFFKAISRRGVIFKD
jgi:squalene synthase HpnC